MERIRCSEKDRRGALEIDPLDQIHRCFGKRQQADRADRAIRAKLLNEGG